MIKKFLVLGALIGTIASTIITSGAGRLDKYNKTIEKLDIIQIYDCNDLTIDILENRNAEGKIIIEKVIGQVLNEKGDGKILNTDEEYYNYINYKNVKEAKKGDIILTYFIYNPDTNYEDDVLDRFDYIIDRKK